MRLEEWARQRYRGLTIRPDGELELPTCPWCGRDRKAWANVRTGRGLCFRCGRRFGAVAWVAQVDRMAPSEAARMLQTGPDDSIRMSERPAPAAVSPATVEWPEASSPVLAGSGPVHQLAHQYCAGRGLDDVDIAWYGLRCCWAGPFAYRVLFPFLDDAGVMQFFGARRIDGLGSGPKMLYPRAERRACLFGLETARMFRDVTIVEGPVDAIHAGRDAVALGGARLSREQLRALRAANFSSITLLLDQDEAGQQGQREAARELLRYGWRVRWGCLPAGCKDPGELAPHDIRAVIDRAPTVSALDLAAVQNRA